MTPGLFYSEESCGLDPSGAHERAPAARTGEGWVHTFRVSEVDLKLTEGNLGLWEQQACGTADLLQL